jgi:exopolyphosphatase/guanosine-5'-triphosphate,3'-diphosphate pyrophosphatase
MLTPIKLCRKLFPMGSKFSAIDIGSNAIRMIVGETQNSEMKLLKKFRAPIRLGRDVFLNGQISDKTLAEAQEAFKKFAATNRKYKVTRCRAVATSAVREAQNKDLFVRSVFDASKISIEVIDGVEEARLVHNAIRNEIDLDKKRILSIDIGGGSVEITFSESGMMSATESFPMGTVRILDQMARRKLNESQLNVIMGEFVAPLTNYLDSHVNSGPLHFAVGTGGNLECMAQLKARILKKSPTTYITVRELGEIAEKLKTMTLKDRMEKLELRPDRVDVILPATLLVQTVLRQARIDKILIPNVGLRDGLLWSTAGLI